MLDAVYMQQLPDIVLLPQLFTQKHLDSETDIVESDVWQRFGLW